MTIPPIQTGPKESGGNPPIQKVIDGALERLAGRVLNIEAEEITDDEGKTDRDHNHRIRIKLKDEDADRASIFALKLNGKPKSELDAIKELASKVEEHLKNRKNPDFKQLSSGALVTCAEQASIEEVNGYLTADGKIAVLKMGEELYMPLPGLLLQTYTHFRAFKEDELIIMTDDHEALRDDDKEGMIFNLSEALTLKKDQLKIHAKDENSESLPDQGKYLILYRKRADARKEV